MARIHEEIDMHEYNDAFVFVPRQSTAATAFLSPTLVVDRAHDQIYLDGTMWVQNGVLAMVPTSQVSACNRAAGAWCSNSQCSIGVGEEGESQVVAFGVWDNGHHSIASLCVLSAYRDQVVREETATAMHTGAS